MIVEGSTEGGLGFSLEMGCCGVILRGRSLGSCPGCEEVDSGSRDSSPGGVGVLLWLGTGVENRDSVLRISSKGGGRYSSCEAMLGCWSAELKSSFVGFASTQAEASLMPLLVVRH